MARGSKRYIQLEARLSELQRNLLSLLRKPPISKTHYNDQELDSTRAYIVLTHAEIEAFCEDIVRKKARSARERFDRGMGVTPVLRRIVSYHVGKNQKSWSDVRTPTADVVERASQSHLTTIQQNQGIKRSNLKKLLFPLGVLETEMDVTWLALMDSFGRERGGVAHSSVRIGTAPDPVTELTTVNQLLAELLTLDRVLGRMQ